MQTKLFRLDMAQSKHSSIRKLLTRPAKRLVESQEREQTLAVLPRATSWRAFRRKM